MNLCHSRAILSRRRREDYRMRQRASPKSSSLLPLTITRSSQHPLHRSKMMALLSDPQISQYKQKRSSKHWWIKLPSVQWRRERRSGINLRILPRKVVGRRVDSLQSLRQLLRCPNKVIVLVGVGRKFRVIRSESQPKSPQLLRLSKTLRSPINNLPVLELKSLIHNQDRLIACSQMLIQLIHTKEQVLNSSVWKNYDQQVHNYLVQLVHHKQIGILLTRCLRRWMGIHL